LGVALVEIGAGLTNVSLFAGGMLVGLASIPFGSGDITDDIASAFGTRRQQAERMKCFYGSATTSPRDNHDMIEVAPMSSEDDAGEGARITRAQLISVIRQRLDHLVGEIARELKALGFTGPVGRQVVLTGGGAELKGLADYMQGALGRAVRLGRPRGLNGLPEAHSGTGFATLAGLVHYAASDPMDLRSIATDQMVTRAAGGGLIKRLMAAFRYGY
jgi:cell division protein FtsA